MNDAPSRRPDIRKSHRRSRYALWIITAASLATAIVALVFALGAIRRLDEMRSRIVLTDAQGRPRVRLQAGAETSYLELVDEQGVTRAALGYTQRTAMLSLYRQGPPDFFPALRLYVNDTYNTAFMRDRKGFTTSVADGQVAIESANGRIVLENRESESPRLSMFTGNEASPRSQFEVSVGTLSAITGRGLFTFAYDDFLNALSRELLGREYRPAADQ